MEESINLNKICQNLLEGLPSRAKEVIVRRFGLKTRERETLEAIGEDHNITRERVRQIENDGFSKIIPKFNQHKQVFEYFNRYLKKEGGLKREDILLAKLGGQKFQNHVYFLLDLNEKFQRSSLSPEFYPFWTNDRNSQNLAKEIINNLLKKLKERNQPLSFSEIAKIYKSDSSAKKTKPLPSEFLLSYIEVSRDIEQGLDNLFGLKYWPEINPRGIRDRAYLAFKKTSKPLHFVEAASFIDRLDLQGAAEKRKTLPQTVHNELIRDPRFVLVGRGIYALKEWGYEPGIVREIIEKTIEERGPMTKEEIIKEVSKQRLVKPNTILINLQNKQFFIKNSEGKYLLKEA